MARCGEISGASWDRSALSSRSQKICWRPYYCAFRSRHAAAGEGDAGRASLIFSPFDAIPDMLPVIGFTDDAAVLAIAINLFGAHISPLHRQLRGKNRRFKAAKYLAHHLAAAMP